MTLNERVMVGRERDKGRCGKGGKGKEGTARERERERERESLCYMFPTTGNI